MSDFPPQHGDPYGPPPAETPSPWAEPAPVPPPVAPPAAPQWPRAWPDAPPAAYPTADWGLPPLPPSPPPPDGFIPRLPPPPPQVRWGIGDVFYGILVIIGANIVVGLILLLTGMIDVDTESGEVGQLGLASLALSMAAMWVGLLGWPLVATYVKGLHSLSKDFGLTIRWGDIGWGVLGGISALAISVVGGILWQILSDSPEPTNSDILPTSNSNVASGIVLFLLVAVCTPIAEELFFRGLFLRAVTKKWTTLIGMLVSSAVFGLFHLTELSINGLFICFITASYGFVLAALVVFRNFRLGPSIIAHGVINGTAVLSLLLT